MSFESITTPTECNEDEEASNEEDTMPLAQLQCKKQNDSQQEGTELSTAFLRPCVNLLQSINCQLIDLLFLLIGNCN